MQKFFGWAEDLAIRRTPNGNQGDCSVSGQQAQAQQVYPARHDNAQIDLFGTSTNRQGLDRIARDLMVNVGADGYAICRSDQMARDDQSPQFVLSWMDTALLEDLKPVAKEAAHLMEKSALPFSCVPEEADGPVSGVIQKLDVTTLSVSVVGFPVQLGVVGNGLVLFTGTQLDLAGDRVIEIHRECYRLMRDLLTMEIGETGQPENLNDRELQCLQLAADGCKSEAIADMLEISVHTVNAYMVTAADKLDSVNRIQAIAKALRLGLIG